MRELSFALPASDVSIISIFNPVQTGHYRIDVIVVVSILLSHVWELMHSVRMRVSMSRVIYWIFRNLSARIGTGNAFEHSELGSLIKIAGNRVSPALVPTNGRVEEFDSGDISSVGKELSTAALIVVIRVDSTVGETERFRTDRTFERYLTKRRNPHHRW